MDRASHAEICRPPDLMAEAGPSPAMFRTACGRPLASRFPFSNGCSIRPDRAMDYQIEDRRRAVSLVWEARSQALVLFQQPSATAPAAAFDLPRRAARQFDGQTPLLGDRATYRFTGSGPICADLEVVGALLTPMRRVMLRLRAAIVQTPDSVGPASSCSSA